MKHCVAHETKGMCGKVTHEKYRIWRATAKSRNCAATQQDRWTEHRVGTLNENDAPPRIEGENLGSSVKHQRRFSFRRAAWSIDCTTRSIQFGSLSQRGLYYSEFEEGDALCMSIGSPEVTCCIADASIDVSTSPSICDVTIGAAVTCYSNQTIKFHETLLQPRVEIHAWRICCCVPFAPRVRTGVTDKPPTFTPELADDVPDPSSIPFESDFCSDVMSGPSTW